MTKEAAIEEATKIAKAQNMVMAVANDSIVNNPEEDPRGPWGYCPNSARHQAGPMKGNLILFPWATEVIQIFP